MPSKTTRRMLAAGAILAGAALVASELHRSSVDTPPSRPALSAEEAEAHRAARKQRREAQEAAAPAEGRHGALVMIALAWFSRLSGR
jgi:hypothetical protein